MADTITKQEPKLSVRKPGHWCNRFAANGCPVNGSLTLSDGKPYEWLTAREYPSCELAEAYGTFVIEKNPDAVRKGGLRYLGPVFFPEGEDA